ncbi:MAG: hypothetical protein K9L30_18210 [Desulfobacterales bacterium]|nr:hypothetical protein [Desulfobacterales bacterium]
MTFEIAIKNQNYKEAEKSLMKIADSLLKKNAHDEIRSLIALFPENYSKNSALLSFYHHTLNHLISPSAAQEGLVRLIPYFLKKQDFCRVVDIYTTLLKTYMVYENIENIINLIEEVDKFDADFGSSLNLNYCKQFRAWINLGKCWVYKDRDRAIETSIQIEETALKLQDELMLIFSLIIMAHLFNGRGKFKMAIEHLDKSLRIIRTNKKHKDYEAFAQCNKANTYLLMRDFQNLKIEIDRGLQNLQEGSLYTFHFYELLFYYDLYKEDIKACEQTAEKIIYNYPEHNSNFRLNFMYFSQLLISYISGNKDKVEYYCKKLSLIENRNYFLYDYPLTYLRFAEASLFIGNYDAALNTLMALLKEIPENKFTYHAVATYALTGLVHGRRKEKKQEQAYYEKMGKVLTAHDIGAINITSLELLKELTDRSNNKQLQNLLQRRLDHIIFDADKQPGFSELKKIPDNYVEIRAFGQLRFILNGHAIPDSEMERHKKAMMLIKLIIVRPDKCIAKEVIYDYFWRNYNTKDARNNLNNMLFRFRKLFGEYKDFISSESEFIRLVKGKYRLDVDVFENYADLSKELLKNCEYEKAISLFDNIDNIYKSDFIENDLYNDLINEERYRLKYKYNQILFNYTLTCLNQGDCHRAYRYAGKLVKSDPLCEPGYRLLMIASVLTGKRQDVSMIMKNLKSRLNKELDVTPEDKTIKLMKKLLGNVNLENSLWDDEQFVLFD